MHGFVCVHVVCLCVGPGSVRPTALRNSGWWLQHRQPHGTWSTRGLHVVHFHAEDLGGYRFGHQSLTSC